MTVQVFLPGTLSPALVGCESLSFQFNLGQGIGRRRQCLPRDITSLINLKRVIYFITSIPKQTYRPMEQNREPRNKPRHLWSINLWQRRQEYKIIKLQSFFFFFHLFAISWAAPMAYGGSQARDRIGAVAASLRQSHNNEGFEPRLQPTPQLTATPDP